MLKKITTQHVNFANIGLLIISALLAIFLPLKLFLFAYAFIGPLHYLTEISWLHKHQYFSKGKYDYLYFILMGILITVFGFAKGFRSTDNVIFTIIVSLIAAFLFLQIKDKSLKIIALLTITAVFFLWPDKQDIYFFDSIIRVLLPTIIHVFIFTAAFMLYGAIKDGHYSGYLTILFLVICTVVVWYVSPSLTYTSENTEKYYSNGFFSINVYLYNLFTGETLPYAPTSIQPVIHSALGYKIMRLVAFAYTYHYLNWFSKTSIIGWHKIPVLNWVLIIVLWVISIMLYSFDYRTGFKWLFLLSILHVFMEFPLNIKTFSFIGSWALNGFKKKSS